MAEEERSPPLAVVVEDQTIVAMVLQAYLEDAGYEVIMAFSAHEAIKALSGPVDVLVADIELGELDGIWLAWEARERHANVAVVLASGRQTPDERELPAGTRFLPKPFNEKQLLREVDAAKAAVRGQYRT
jgi:CheY-like chemotaxis protein